MLYDPKIEKRLREELKPKKLWKWQLVLLKAADIVENGWVQGRCHSIIFLERGEIQNNYCAIGAINQAAGKNPHALFSFRPSIFYARRRLKKLIKQKGFRKNFPSIFIAEWNDHWDRTQKEVASVLRSAANV